MSSRKTVLLLDTSVNWQILNNLLKHYILIILLRQKWEIPNLFSEYTNNIGDFVTLCFILKDSNRKMEMAMMWYKEFLSLNVPVSDKNYGKIRAENVNCNTAWKPFLYI